MIANQPNYQFLIAINDEYVNSESTEDSYEMLRPQLNPVEGINLYFLKDYEIEPFSRRNGMPKIINLNIKVSLLDLNLYDQLMRERAQLIENIERVQFIENVSISNLENNIELEQSIADIENKCKKSYMIIPNNNGLEYPIILNTIVVSKNDNNYLCLYVHNLSNSIIVFRKNTSLFQLIVHDLTPVTMKIISINDSVFS